MLYADNPIIQTNYTGDPAPMVYNDRFYVYCGHDEDVIVNNFFTMNEWRCYSSSDMVNWTDHGGVLNYKTFTWAQGDAWAAQCIPRNGKFYFYVTVTRKGGGRTVGVAVASSPTGPFTDPLGKPLIANNGSQDIDPTVFIDADGQAYVYWGNPNLYYVKLNQDMISYTGGVVLVSSKPSNYQEAPWFYKRSNFYYMVYAATCCPEYIAYATSSAATGPWTAKGTIMAAQGASFTNHPGIVDFKNNSYFVYHNGALKNGGGYHRSVCIEQFKYNSDGTIPSMTMGSSGPSQVGSHSPYDTTQAETICWESGVRTNSCNEGGLYVDSIHNGDYIKIKGVDFGTEGATSFSARVASASSGGSIELRLGSLTGTLIGTCAVSGSGGWQTWITKTCTVSGATGKNDLYLKFTGGSGMLFNVNWWKFNGQGVDVYKTDNRTEHASNISITSAQQSSVHISIPYQGSNRNNVITTLYNSSGRNCNSHLVNCSYNGVRYEAAYSGLPPGLYIVSIQMGNNSSPLIKTFIAK
jgi:hypothetical protein